MRFLFWLVLILVLITSAIAVVHSKYHSRLLFIEIQKQQRVLDKQMINWGLLQLEVTTLTAENRVELEATNKLDLVLPSHRKIIYIKP